METGKILFIFFKYLYYYCLSCPFWVDRRFFFLLEDNLCIWLMEEFMNSYVSCYWRYKNNRSDLVLKKAVFF